mmetsp:Transcript_1636/g.3795  ORF Transcript_1636/g.3795 Transcript_1636/m.3795 type:complete len:145 (+) Transcript_1636:809-1243(+)
MSPPTKGSQRTTGGFLVSNNPTGHGLNSVDQPGAVDGATVSADAEVSGTSAAATAEAPPPPRRVRRPTGARGLGGVQARDAGCPVRAVESKARRVPYSANVDPSSAKALQIEARRAWRRRRAHELRSIIHARGRPRRRAPCART